MIPFQPARAFTSLVVQLVLPPTPTPGRHDEDEEVGLEEMITRHITGPWGRELSLMSRPDLRASKILRRHAAGEGTIDNMAGYAF